MASNALRKVQDSDYPLTKIEDPARPIRLYDSTEKKMLPWRCFSNLLHAHQGASTEALYFSKGNTVIEVYDARNGRIYGQYKAIRTEDGSIKLACWRSHDRITREML